MEQVLVLHQWTLDMDGGFDSIYKPVEGSLGETQP